MPNCAVGLREEWSSYELSKEARSTLGLLFEVPVRTDILYRQIFDLVSELGGTVNKDKSNGSGYWNIALPERHPLGDSDTDIPVLIASSKRAYADEEFVKDLRYILGAIGVDPLHFPCS